MIALAARALGAVAIAASASAWQGGPPTTPRGITGSVEIVHAGEPLQAKVDQERSAPMLVRVTDLTPDAQAGAAHRYRVDYIGVVTGNFDLRELIRHRDGTPADDLPSITVRIVSELPARHGTDLFSEPDPPTLTPSHYRLAVVALAAAWLGIPIFVLVRKWIRARPLPPAPPPTPAPSLADQLRPLVEAAMKGEMSVSQQAALELLLLAYWSERRSLDRDSPARALAVLRADPEAGALLNAVESWLHSRSGATPLAPHEIQALLEPYRQGARSQLREVAQ